MGIEPTNKGFADPRLTTWPRRRMSILPCETLHNVTMKMVVLDMLANASSGHAKAMNMFTGVGCRSAHLSNF